LCNEEIHVAYIAGGSKRIGFRSLVVKPAGNILHGRARYRWEDNVKICLKQIGWDGALHCCGQVAIQ
jgi:hypothetical protein